MKETEKDASNPVRRAVVQTLSSVEDLVYVGLGLLLTIVAVTLLIIALKRVVLAVWTRALGG